ncbi:enkurin domain-containing protein 1 [Patella vulgata]|uniref:enkurin domain-containing protein 1 n=1 Tax=Patella vulgata TaxID=6465 RepID=UPI00217FBEE6|nr:enkurin domain-containing protein 1 [Patella vulgata]
MQSLMFQVDGHSYGGPKQYNSVQNFSSKNHIQENVRRMRQIQRKSRENEKSSQEPMKALWKSSKFENVPSKVVEELVKEPRAPRPQSANYLRAHSRSGPVIKLQSRPCTPEYHKVSVPLADSKVNLVRNNFDFIKVNGIGAKHGKLHKSPSLTALDDLKNKQERELTDYHRGEVPKYLKARKAQWKREDEERIANTPDPTMPPGHRALSNEERRETLDLLIKKQGELQNQMSKLPLRTDTMRIRTVKNDIETKLSEVEEAIKIFSRPKVFVKINQ